MYSEDFLVFGLSWIR